MFHSSSPFLVLLTVCGIVRSSVGFLLVTRGDYQVGNVGRDGIVLAAAFQHPEGEAISSAVTNKGVDDPRMQVITGPELPPIPHRSKRLFLVRHGAVINPGGDRPVYYGAMDVPLSPLGEWEAQAAAQYLQQFDLQHVASSPLSRAIYGATQVLQRQATTTATRSSSSSLETTSSLMIHTGWKELDRGSWCGKTHEEIGTEAMAAFDACDESKTPDGGESYPALKERVLQARDELLESMDSGRASVLVSHLQVTRCMLSDALGVPTCQMSQLPIATASVTCIDYDSATCTQTVHFQSFKPNVGLEQSRDEAN
jgi:broad specificity phosphatase PhoE